MVIGSYMLVDIGIVLVNKLALHSILHSQHDLFRKKMLTKLARKLNNKRACIFKDKERAMYFDTAGFHKIHGENSSFITLCAAFKLMCSAISFLGKKLY